MFKSIATLSAIAGFAPLVAAHGWVRSVKIDGVLFEGRTPNTDFDKPTPIRQIDTVNPVKGAETRAMNCGSNATPSTFSAEANPGSVLEFDWAGGDGGKWPHNTGPMITYMASCGAGGCVNFDPIDADFFKIDQQGKRDDGVWVQQELFDGGVARVTLPTTLPEGEYLVRHEVIGLHIASNFQGAEFYPSCTAIKLAAPANPAIAKLPSGAETARFPGAYRDDDPGILLNVFNGQPYTQFPGPAVADFGGAPAQDSPVTDGPAVIDTPPVDAPPVEAPPATGGGNNGGGNNCNGGVQKRGLPDRRTHVQRLRDFRDHLAARAAERGLGESDYFGAKMKREPTRPYVMSRYFRNLN